MMKSGKKRLPLLIAMVLCVSLLAGTAYAALNQRTIDVRSGVTIYVDNEEFIPRDANGNVVEAFIHSGTTYLPLRALSEMLGQSIEWDEETGSVYISSPQSPENPSQEETGMQTTNGDIPVVYMTADISPEGLMAIYEALGREAAGDNVGVKISTGEPGGNHFLSPSLIKDLVQTVNGTIIESNTAYGGQRASTALHYQVAEDHGFTAIAPVVIMDETDSISIPITGGSRLTENYVGAHFPEYDFHVVLSHFKGHAMAGFGGALKNLSIGYASSAGKSWIHTGGNSLTGFMGEQDAFLESMAEAAKSVVDYAGEDILYINVMNHLSVDCDCSSNPAEPTMADIAILASLDPVALDKACIDLVYAADDGQDLIERIESRNGTLVLDHAAKIGLGSLEYNLVSID